MLTDYAIALESWLFSVLLWQQHQRSTQLWAIGFAAVGMAAIAGGPYHGLALSLPFSLTLLLWQSTLYSIGISSTFALLGTSVSSLSRRSQPLFFLAVGLKLSLYLYLVATQSDFSNAIADYFSAIVIILLLQITQKGDRPKSSLIWLIASITLSILAASFLWGQVSLLALNPEASYHLIQMGALYLLFCGAKLLKDNS